MTQACVVEVMQREHGVVVFFARPRVGLAELRAWRDVQRLDFVTLPHRRAIARRIQVGRKHLPRASHRDKQWAYVERVEVGLEEAMRDLGEEQYETKTRGVRHQAAAREVARGSYTIGAHDEHAHLGYELDDLAGGVGESLVRELGLEERASFIAAVFNPARTGFRRDRPPDAPPFGEPSMLPDDLMDRFGRRRFLPLEPEFLDFEGVELLLIGGGEPRAEA